MVACVWSLVVRKLPGMRQPASSGRCDGVGSLMAWAAALPPRSRTPSRRWRGEPNRSLSWSGRRALPFLPGSWLLCVNANDNSLAYRDSRNRRLLDRAKSSRLLVYRALFRTLSISNNSRARAHTTPAAASRNQRAALHLERARAQLHKALTSDHVRRLRGHGPLTRTPTRHL